MEVDIRYYLVDNEMKQFLPIDGFGSAGKKAEEDFRGIAKNGFLHLKIIESDLHAVIKKGNGKFYLYRKQRPEEGVSWKIVDVVVKSEEQLNKELLTKFGKEGATFVCYDKTKMFMVPSNFLSKEDGYDIKAYFMTKFELPEEKIFVRRQDGYWQVVVPNLKDSGFSLYEVGDRNCWRLRDAEVQKSNRTH